MTETKICVNRECSQNGSEQPIENFYAQSKGKDRHMSWCKDCTKRTVTESRKNRAIPVHSPRSPAPVRPVLHAYEFSKSFLELSRCLGCRSRSDLRFVDDYGETLIILPEDIRSIHRMKEVISWCDVLCPSCQEMKKRGTLRKSTIYNPLRGHVLEERFEEAEYLSKQARWATSRYKMDGY